jgi:hypothetical protein
MVMAISFGQLAVTRTGQRGMPVPVLPTMEEEDAEVIVTLCTPAVPGTERPDISAPQFDWIRVSQQKQVMMQQ